VQTRWLRLLFVMAFAVAALRGASGGHTVASSTSPLDFVVTLPSTEFQLGDPILLTMALQNISSQPQLVNKRLLINDAAAADAVREVFLRITLPSGEEARFAYDVTAGFPSAADFVLLGPGEGVDTSLQPADLADLYTLTEVGSYAVTAVYVNRVPGPLVFDDASGAYVQQDLGAVMVQVESNTLYFQIDAAGR
jgi:hypothetical protein